MWSWFCRLFPPARRPALDELGERSWRVLSAYVKGVVFVAFVDAVGIGLGAARSSACRSCCRSRC